MKNIESSFPHFVNFLTQLSHQIPSLQIVLYEDGSTDKTKDFLQQLAHSPNIHIRSETVDYPSWIRTWDNLPCRIECIARARNRLMEMLESLGLGTRSEDLCILLDPDVPPTCPYPLQRLVELLQTFPDVDGLFANGRSMYSGKYYDLFAYRDKDFLLDYDVLGEELGGPHIQEKGERIGTLGFKTEPTPVLSAFGGLAIYRGSAIRGLRYSATPTPALDALYRSSTRGSESELLKKAQSNVATHRFGALQGMYLVKKKEEGGLFYFNCYGYNVPIVCEHIPFHAAMIANGKSRLFLDPLLIYQTNH